MEYSQGIAAGIGKHVFTVGNDPAFFVRAKLKLADVTGLAECAVGFRKAEAYNTLDSYDEMAAFNIQLGVVNTETILNNATTVTTDTTETDWADGETHELTVLVNHFGQVTYLYDGEEPTTVAAFTFDTGEVVVPFLHLLHAATTPGAVHLVEWECGYQRV